MPNLTAEVAELFYAFSRKPGAFLNEVNLAELN
jgi:hypothetical protein